MGLGDKIQETVGKAKESVGEAVGNQETSGWIATMTSAPGIRWAARTRARWPAWMLVVNGTSTTGVPRFFMALASIVM